MTFSRILATVAAVAFLLGFATIASGQPDPVGGAAASANKNAPKTGVKFTEEKLSVRTKAGSVAFTVEIADNDAERAQGLMNRESLAADRGMLFDFETSRHVHMWMRNTLIPLDMVFIDAKGRIISIAGARPLSDRQISSGGEILAVLELNAGTARARGIKVGDFVEHRLFKPTATAKAKK